jgi:hypothetical protein
MRTTKETHSLSDLVQLVFQDAGAQAVILHGKLVEQQLAIRKQQNPAAFKADAVRALTELRSQAEALGTAATGSSKQAVEAMAASVER